jgi:hypothetical protein
MKTRTTFTLGRSVRLVHHICQLAGASSLIDDSRVGLARHGVIAAVQRHDTPAIFDWLLDARSYQGVSDSRAVRWSAAALATAHKEEVSTHDRKSADYRGAGIDVDGRAHASRFEERDTPFVQRAAELMGFHLIRVAADNAELRAIAEKLPLGKIFATGRAFVPFVGHSAFEKLAALVEGGVTIEARATSGAAPVYPLADMFTTDAINTADALWSKVEVGTVVLAAQPDLYGPGWWEGVVVGIDGDDLTLRWTDDPALDPFHLSRREIALRHPGAD